jgi:hypothetical protein
MASRCAGHPPAEKEGRHQYSADDGLVHIRTSPGRIGVVNKSVWLINRVATVMSATKNPPDGLIERVSSKEVPRRLREPRGPDHSNGSGHSNTGKKPAIAGKNARADGNSGAKTTLN